MRGQGPQARRDQVVAAVAAAGADGLTVREIQDRTGLDFAQVVQAVAAANRAGLLFRVGFGRWAVVSRREQNNT